VSAITLKILPQAVRSRQELHPSYQGDYEKAGAPPFDCGRNGQCCLKAPLPRNERVIPPA
jgi:hypothetical protein